MLYCDPLYDDIYVPATGVTKRSSRVISATTRSVPRWIETRDRLRDLLRLTQIISIGVLFMGLCALEANCGESVVEHEDDIRRPLMEDDAQSGVPDLFGGDIIVDRLLARFEVFWEDLHCCSWAC